MHARSLVQWLDIDTRQETCIVLQHLVSASSSIGIADKVVLSTIFMDRERGGGGRGERGRDRDRERHRERQKENNTLLHKNKDLNTSRLFYKSVPDNKHSNT